MAFRQTKIIMPCLAIMAGFYGAYKFWSYFYKHSSSKNQAIDELLQDVEAELTVEDIAEEAKEGNLKGLTLIDECNFGSTSASICSTSSPLHLPSLYKLANCMPNSIASSAEQTNTCEEKDETILEIVSATSNSPASSLTNPARSSRLSDEEHTSALLTLTEIQEDSISSIAETTRHTITDLSSSVSSFSHELTNELKIEIENMKSLLPIYSETFIGLRMGRELGGGAFGRVYEVDTRHGKVAVKVLIAKELATRTKAVSMHKFYTEALLLSNLNHPNILSFELIISDVPPNGYPGMATELMSEDLHNFISRIGGLKSWNDIWNIAVQVAKGLKYLHSQKIIHFDIKSSNILLNYSGNPIPNILICKVADFGLAMKNSSGAPVHIYSQRGSVHYMAPEVMRTSRHGMQSVTEKVDVYSFGILLWELIMGELPYNGMRDDQIESFVVNGRRPNIPQWCDIGWKWLMKACWNKDQDQRPNFDEIVGRFSCLLGA